MKSRIILLGLTWLTLSGCGEAEKPFVPIPPPPAGGTFETPRLESKLPANKPSPHDVGDEIRKAAYESAMMEGDQASKAGRPSQAAGHFRDALSQRPDDKEASARLLEAEFLALMERGKAALDEGRFAEALKALRDAAKRRPDEQGCLDLLAQAVAKRRNQLIDEGKAELEARKYPEAVRALTEAKDLKPDDDDVKSLLAEATFQAKLREGQILAQAKQWDFAVANLNEAVRLKPDHPEALDLLKKAKDEKIRQDKADFDRLLAAGDSAMQRKDYQSAFNSYLQATIKQPGDSKARAKLNQAQNAKLKQESFDRHMRTGQAMMAAKNYLGARVEFQAALNDQPGNSLAMRWLQQAQQAKR